MLREGQPLLGNAPVQSGNPHPSVARAFIPELSALSPPAALFSRDKARKNGGKQAGLLTSKLLKYSYSVFLPKVVF